MVKKGSRAQGSRLRAQGSGLTAQGSGLRAQGSGLEEGSEQKFATPVYGCHGNPPAGLSIRDSHADQEPRAHDRGSFVAGARHRRQHHDLHLYQWTAFASASGRGTRPPARSVAAQQYARQRHRQPHAAVVSRLRVLPGPQPRLQRHGRVHRRDVNGDLESQPAKARRFRAALVSANFFSILGVQPALGRAFLPEDDRARNAAPVVVLSHALWEQRLGSDPAIVGKNTDAQRPRLHRRRRRAGRIHRLAGGFTPDVWMPMAMQRAMSPALNPAERHMHWILGIGRLKPGVTRAQANADLAVLGQQLATDFPDANRNLHAGRAAVELVPSPFRGLVGGVERGVDGGRRARACSSRAPTSPTFSSRRRRAGGERWRCESRSAQIAGA